VSRRAPTGGTQKFVTFFLVDEEYGLEILKVHEIIGMMNITRVPRTPDCVRGVINLRGKIIPIVDLRLKFSMPPTEDTEQTCIIVVQSNGLQVGVVVDRVSEVLDINTDDIEETPSFGQGINTDYILGIGRAEGSVKLLLDIDKVLGTQSFAAAAGDAPPADAAGTVLPQVKAA
jgi:purine-binding chemotaxis protein CheW